MHRVRCAVFACATLALQVVPAHAQGPRGADTLSPRAVAESLAVIRRLDSIIAKAPNDARAWFQRGMIGWALADRARAEPPVRGLDWTLLGRMADTSLRIAAQIDAHNAEYRLMVGRFLLMSGVSITRFAAGGFFEDALTVARADTNAEARAYAAIEVGRVHWRRYDTRENRRIETSPGAAIRSVSRAAVVSGSEEGGMTTTQSLKGIEDALALTTQTLPFDLAGGPDYERAEALFREAYEALPGNARAFHQLAMLLAARSRWTELTSLARAQVARAPWNAWAWMTLGLATHRAGDSRSAAAAYDSAMSYMTKDERARLDRVERVLRDADTTIASRGDAATQLATRRLYWMFADPLWSRDGNESRVEFLARVTYAELRWTVEEMGVRGADSDRGDIHVRYGPADVVASFGSGSGEDAGKVSIVWLYQSGLIFTFTGAPTFATARIPVEDEVYIDEVRDAQPVRWDNLTRMTIDSLPVQPLRFRAGTDSVDLFVAVTPDVARIRSSMSLRSTPRADYWLLTGGSVAIHHDTARLSQPMTPSWTRRVAPGTYVYRVEASAESATIAARATAAVVADNDAATGFALRGFGISDVMIASNADQRGSSPTRRWTDYRITPSAGTIPLGGTVTFLWENYDFTPRGTSSEYRIAIAIQRERSAAGRVAARVVSRVSGALGIDQSDDRVVVRFDRTVAHAAAMADFVTMELAGTPAGRYRATLEITDLVSGRTTSRTTSFVIR
ncbi:MAG TPA: GWxTD domain-containing protein [Gemmatimonadaceae bacterium]|nr:GWxTD domain-containing protein [Gemmatimonadaceae bacterium]